MIKNEIVDIHSHMIPGVDDGAEDYVEAIELIKLDVKQGVKTIFLTPHSGAFEHDGEYTQRIYNALKSKVKEESLGVELLLGAEIYVSEENIDYILRLLQQKRIPTLNDSCCVLVEFTFWEGSVKEIIYCVDKFVEAGFTPVIAHVERCGMYINADDVEEIVKHGAKTQINLNDLFVEGDMPEWVKLCRELLKRELVTFVGTDSHNVMRRFPKVKKPVEFLYENYREEYVDDILFRNARKYLYEMRVEFFTEIEDNSKDIEDNLYLPGVMGVVVGDALGCPVQFKTREQISDNLVTGMRGYGTFNLPAGSWTDDSSLTIAELSSIKDKQCIDLNDIMKRFTDWLDKGDYTPYGTAYDIGLTCERAIENFRRSKDVKTCGLNKESDNGNGSLMRILPVCIFVYEKVKEGAMSEDEGIRLIHDASSLTHGHRRTLIACGLYYFCIKNIIDFRDEKTIFECLKDGLAEGKEFYRKDILNLTELSYFGRMFDTDEFAKLDSKSISSSGYVLSSIEAAIWSLLSTDSFESALLKAVNLADDSDTVGAIAGGLAGLYYGYDSIPEEWLNEIKRREWIEGWCLK